MGMTGERFALPASKWPVMRTMKSIEDFLPYEPRALSYKATAGWQRVQASRLAYPADFAQALKAHLKKSRPLKDREKYARSKPSARKV